MRLPPNALHLTVSTILVLILLALLGASWAVAQPPDKGAPAWTFAMAKRHYHKSAEAAGTNYQTIPIAYRERALRSEMAFTACLASYAVLYPDREPQALKDHCIDRDAQWRAWLNQAILDTGAFPHVFAGQSAIAMMHVKRIHQVLRYTLRELTYEDAKNRLVLRKYTVPMLVKQKQLAEQAGEIPNLKHPGEP